MERLLRRYSAHLQTVYERMPSLVRNLLVTARGVPLSRNRYHPEMYALCRELRSHESWSRQRVREFQLQSLREALEHARRTVPYYRKYPRLEWNSLDEIRELPVLLREDVRSHAAEFLCRSIPESQLIRVSTTGTTGASLTVGYTQALMRTTFAFHQRQRAWAGMAPRDPRITLFGSRVVPPTRSEPPYWAYNMSENQTLMSIFHLSENTADDYIRFLKRNKGLIVEAFPSVLGILSDFILERDQRVSMRAVFTDGEPLYPFVREKIETAFQTKVYDTYGNTELCGLIQECEHGQMHLAFEFGYVEVLDENNNPVRESEEGYLVWTTLANRVTPLIRYRIGDRGCWLGGTCPCGRAFPLMRPTITRASDLLHHPDGRVFSPRALNQVLKGYSSLRFCQFVQHDPQHVTVRGVSSTAHAGQDLAKVCVALRGLLGDGMQVSSELASEPIIRSGGKIPLIVRQTVAENPVRSPELLCQA